jgi:hypothetical protein
VCFPADVDDLKTLIGKFQLRIDKLESHVKILENKCGVVSPAVPCGASAPKATSAAPTTTDEVVDGDDANVDLFGSDSEVRLMFKWVEYTLLVLKSKNYNILYNSHNPNLLEELTLHPCPLNHLWNRRRGASYARNMHALV